MRAVTEYLARNRAGLIVVATIAALPAGARGQTTHRIPLSPETIQWGYFDASSEPVVRIRSGDRVSFDNMLARGLDRLRLAGFDESRFTPEMLAVETGVTDRLGSHPLDGPIYVEGASPGDAIEVRFLDIGFLTPYGVSGHLPGGGTLPDDFPYGGLRRFEIDTIAGIATMQDAPDVAIPIRPFFGTVGVAPPALSGRVSSHAPGPWVGNLDNKELVEGTSLFLPVHVEGALLSIGDGHAAQGDGEVSGTAIETSLRGTIEVVVHPDMALRWPRAETPTHYISMGLNPDLDVAAQMAVQEMIDFLVTTRGMDRSSAYVLCSVALDLRVTQLVDGTKGVHGMLAKALFR